MLLADASDGRLELAVWEATSPAELRHETWLVQPDGSLPPKTSLRGILATAMQNTEPVRVGEGTFDRARSAAYDDDDERSSFTLSSALAVPLEWEDGAPLGAIALYDRPDDRPFASEDVELLRLIAANFCTAIRLFRARAEREREARLSTIGSLLSGIVHDLKGPMAVISGYVQVMIANTRREAAPRLRQAGPETVRQHRRHATRSARVRARREARAGAQGVPGQILRSSRWSSSSVSS